MIDFRIIKLNIFNFACYYGKNELDFSAKSNKNIYLFKLRNGFGKTSLFHAIKWVFYGEEIDYYKDSEKINTKEFLNDRLDSKDLCFVETTFEYGKEVYILKRTLQPSVNKISNFSLIKNGREITDTDLAQEELNQIMPINFADFFMFDGEKLSHYMTAQKELSFRDSIHQLLGLKQIRVLRDDLIKLQERYDNKLTQQKSTSKEIESKKKIILDILREIHSRTIKIDNYKKEISDNEITRDGLEEYRLRYENLPKVMNDFKKLTEKKSRLLIDIAQREEKIQKNSENFFIKFIEYDIKNFISSNDERLSDLKDVCGLTDTQADTQNSRKDILKNSIPICNVCGHKLTAEEKKKLADEQKKIQNSLKIFGENRKERDGIKNENNQFSSALELLKECDFQKELDDLQEKKLKVYELEKEMKVLDKESQKEKYGSLSKINREISLIDEDNTKKKDQITILTQQIKGYKEQKEEVTKEIKRLGHDDKITAKTTALSSYVFKLTRQMDEALELGTTSKRNQILKKANELFKDITNKPEEYKGIEFESEDTYAFVIKTKDEKIVTNPSKGEKQVLAMSFLLGLNQYTGRNNVILMDTPVASLDDVHSAGIGKALANLKNQVLFLAQPQELSGEIYKNMKKAVVKEYLVERQDYKSTFKEVKI